MSKKPDSSGPPDGLLKSLLRSDSKKDGEIQSKCLEAFRNRGPMQPAMTWPEIEQQLHLQSGSTDETGESLPKWFLELIQHDIIRESEATKDEPVRYKLNDQPAFGERAMERLERIRAAKEQRSLSFMKALFVANVVLFATIYVFFLPQSWIAWMTGAIGVTWALVGALGLRFGSESKSLLSVLPRRGGIIGFALLLVLLGIVNLWGLTMPLEIYGPQGAQVWINGKFVGRIPDAEPAEGNIWDPFFCRLSLPTSGRDNGSTSFEPGIFKPLKIRMRFQMQDVRVAKPSYTFGLYKEFNSQVPRPKLSDHPRRKGKGWIVLANGEPSVQIRFQSAERNRRTAGEVETSLSEYGEWLNDSFWEIIGGARNPDQPVIIGLAVDLELLRLDNAEYRLKMTGRDLDGNIILSRWLTEKLDIGELGAFVAFSKGGKDVIAQQLATRERLRNVSQEVFEALLQQLGILPAVGESSRAEVEAATLVDRLVGRVDNKILANSISRIDVELPQTPTVHGLEEFGLRSNESDTEEKEIDALYDLVAAHHELRSEHTSDLSASPRAIALVKSKLRRIVALAEEGRFKEALSLWRHLAKVVSETQREFPGIQATFNWISLTDAERTDSASNNAGISFTNIWNQVDKGTAIEPKESGTEKEDLIWEISTALVKSKSSLTDYFLPRVTVHASNEQEAVGRTLLAELVKLKPEETPPLPSMIKIVSSVRAISPVVPVAGLGAAALANEANSDLATSATSDESAAGDVFYRLDEEVVAIEDHKMPLSTEIRYYSDEHEKIATAILERLLLNYDPKARQKRVYDSGKVRGRIEIWLSPSARLPTSPAGSEANSKSGAGESASISNQGNRDAAVDWTRLLSHGAPDFLNALISHPDPRLHRES